MGTDVLLQAVTTVGFPIVAYAGMFWYMIKKDAIHKEETEQLRQSIDNNTLVIQKFIERMEVD